MKQLSSASQKHGDTDRSAWDLCKVQKMMPHYHSSPLFIFHSFLLSTLPQPFLGPYQPNLFFSIPAFMPCGVLTPLLSHTGKLTLPHLSGIVFHTIPLLSVSPFTSFSNATCELFSPFQALKSASNPPPLLKKLSHNPNDPIPT